MTGQINVNKIAARTGTTINVASGHTLLQPGAVIQTVSMTVATEVSSTSASYVATNVTKDITPKFSSSKILVSLHCSIYNSGGGLGSCALYRDSTNLTDNTYGLGYCNNSLPHCLSTSYLDSPNTTSAITYALRFKTHNSGTVYACISNTQSFMTLQEIAQ